MSLVFLWTYLKRLQWWCFVVSKGWSKEEAKNHQKTWSKMFSGTNPFVFYSCIHGCYHFLVGILFFFCLFVFSSRCIFRTFRCTTTQQRTSPFTRHAIVMNVYGTWEKSNKRQSAHTKRVWILSTSSVNMWAQKSCKFTPKLSIVWQWQTTEAASRSWFYWITWV